MKEIPEFIAKAERFLTSAEHLAAIGDYDSCASRCYYAAFFMAEAALIWKGIAAWSHRSVIRLFGQHFIRTGVFPAELGRLLSRAYDARLTADYAVGFGVSREEAENLLRATRQFVWQVRSYLESQSLDRQEGDRL